MALVARPTDFDVLLTENMFGDILSDQAGACRGLAGNAGIGEHRRPGWSCMSRYTARRPTSPARASPIRSGAILSTAMLLRYSFKLEAEAACIEAAVSSVLASGHRTQDLANADEVATTTSDMGRAVTWAVRECLKTREQLLQATND